MSIEGQDPWIVREPTKHDPLPESAYMVEFVGVEDTQITDKESGKTDPKWRWRWRVATGQHAGTETDTLTDRKISPNDLAGRLIAGLISRPLKDGEPVKALVDGCVGKRYMGVCAKGPQGGKAAIRVITDPPE